MRPLRPCLSDLCARLCTGGEGCSGHCYLVSSPCPRWLEDNLTEGQTLGFIQGQNLLRIKALALDPKLSPLGPLDMPHGTACLALPNEDTGSV